MSVTPGTSGIAMGSYNSKNIIEDFMKAEYQDGLRNEFSTMDALINKLSKDTISGKKKYKSFALGITDNVRALGRSNDTYEIGFDGFYNKGRETVDAEFDTTKLMATFSITDEAILKGTGEGSLIDVLKDSLNMMELNLKVTMNRYTYGSHDGKIGTVSYVSEYSYGTHDVNSAKPKWDAPNNNWYTDRVAPYAMRIRMTNSACLMPGMGVLLLFKTVADGVTTANFLASGVIWQKVNDTIYEEDLLVQIDKVATAGYHAATADFTPIAPTDAAALALFKKLTGDTDITEPQTSMTAVDETVTFEIYARQFVEGAAVQVKDEYHGLEDIVMTQDNNIFGVDRSVYKALNCSVWKGKAVTSGTTGAVTSDGTNYHAPYYLGEELLRDMSDHLATTSPDGTGVTLVASTHRVISGIEKSMYQFKDYSVDSGGNGFNLGNRANIVFDTYVLYKDKYARSDNGGAYVYMLDQAKIGELVRRDFQWITDGEVNGVLQRRPGTELFEGIMNKYADMYIDAWKCHGAFKNVKEADIGTAVPTAYAGQ